MITECLNRVELIGTVGSARESTVGGHRMIRFSLATNYAYKNENGEALIETTWHSSVFFPKDDITIAKGDKLHVIGRIRNQRFVTESGEERMMTEVSVSKAEKIDNGETLQYEK